MSTIAIENQLWNPRNNVFPTLGPQPINIGINNDIDF